MVAATAGTEAFAEAGESTGGSSAGSGGGSSGGAASPSNGGEVGEGGEATTPSGGSPATAGRAQGGTAGTESTAGTGGVSPLAECTPVGVPRVTDTECALELACPSKSISTYCALSSEDAWFCNCGGWQTEVRGLTGAEVCEAVSEICASDGSPPDECSLTVEIRLPTSCELTRSCVRAVQIGNSSSSIVSEDSVKCDDDGTGRMNCYCKDGRRFAVTGASGDQACDTMLETCAGDSSLGFEGEAPCTITSEAGDSGFCDTSARCERITDLGDGAAAIEVEEVELSCQTAAGGGSRCACVGREGQAYFDIEPSTNGSSTCTDYVSLCGSAETTALSAIECELEIQGAGDQGAFVQMQCGQLASYGGRTVIVYGYMMANCSLVDETYLCTCSSLEATAQIEVEASSDWDAGSAAAEECPQVIKPRIGNDLILAPVSPPTG
jgi:hypothetical protein